jgi:hypothetical protein
MKMKDLKSTETELMKMEKTVLIKNPVLIYRIFSCSAIGPFNGIS